MRAMPSLTARRAPPLRPGHHVARAYARDRPMAPLPPPAVDRSGGGPPPPPPPPAPRGKSLLQALAFNAAPELINGRLACVFFLYAATTSARTGLPFAAQLATLTPGSGAALDITGIALAATIIVASLIPVMKGAVNEPFGPLFTPARELFHCRAAMLGFVVVMALEARAGVAFF